MNKLEKIGNAYRSTALMVFNLLVFLLTINIGLAIIFFVYDRMHGPADQRIETYREKFADLNAYTVLTKQEANSYLDEQDAMQAKGFQYAPWVQFRNPEVHGIYLNTDSHGWRKTAAPSMQRQGDPLKIFVFGGSTTFGYGVPDNYTIPSYMQHILERLIPDRPIQVRNFGQGFYYSSQEMILFLSRLKDGDIPDIAVFIDGANDTHQLSLGTDQPYFSDALVRLWQDRAGNHKAGLDAYAWIPMIRLALALSRRVHPSGKDDSALKAIGPEDEKNTAYVISRYQQNMKVIRALCAAYGVRPLFVWQPVPFFKYDTSLLKTLRYDAHWLKAFRSVYSALEHYSQPDFLFLGNMIAGASEKMFVDNVHYNERLSERIAARISERLIQRLTPVGRLDIMAAP